MLIRRLGTQATGGRQQAERSGSIDLAGTQDFDFGSLRVQPSILQLTFDGSSHTVEPRVMQVLALLANEPGRVVSRDRLIESCWAGRVVSEDAINRCIAKVRKLGAQSSAFEVETIPRVGYRLIASGVESGRDVPTRRRLLVALGATLVLAAGVGGLWYRGSTNAPRQPKMAVLPFKAFNSDSDAKDFGQSLTVTIANALIKTGARLSADNIRTINDARRSGAALIISGTIRREGTSFRVSAQVDSARSRSTILTNEFEAEAADRPILAGRIAAWLIPSVRMWASFLPVERDSEVTDEIVRIFLTRHENDHLRAWKLSRALARAKPRSGSAQFVFALLTSDVLSEMTQDERAGAIKSARGAARKAADQLPNRSRALALLDCNLTAPGFLVLTPTCDQRVRAAISADPDIPLLSFIFGTQLANSGRFLEAVKFLDMDLAQTPLGPSQLGFRVFTTQMTHLGDAENRLPELRGRMRRYLGPGSTAYFDFRAAIANGNLATAQALLNGPTSGPNIASGDAKDTISLVLNELRSKGRGGAKAIRDRCNPPPPEWTPGDPAFGTCLVGLTVAGDLDAVFRLATRGYRDVECCSAAQQEQDWLASGGQYYPRWELFGKAMASARADPRFIDIARRTGLLAYWKSGHPPDFCFFEQAPVCKLLGT